MGYHITIVNNARIVAQIYISDTWADFHRIWSIADMVTCASTDIQPSLEYGLLILKRAKVDTLLLPLYNLNDGWANVLNEYRAPLFRTYLEYYLWLAKKYPKAMWYKENLESVTLKKNKLYSYF